MEVENGKVTFYEYDMHFVSKFGLEEATEMVLDYKANNQTPFIFDTHQLAAFLHLGNKSFFRMLRGCNRYYHYAKLRKKNGKIRIINAPLSALKYVQYRILYGILNFLPVSRYATAYKRGATLKANAAPHTGKKYLLKLDIKDFFGSIYFDMVYSAAFNTKYFPKHIGAMITALCCRDGVLPQGAPTSPALSNLVMKNFDDNLGAWCEKRGIAYTRYCDDMTFSADTPLYTVFEKVKSMLEGTSFELNEEKTHFVSKGSRQSVTGLTVNEKVAVSSDYKRNLRQELYYVFKFGPADSLLHRGNEDYHEDGVINVLRYLDCLEGKINYVLSVEGGNEYFKKALNSIRKLRMDYGSSPHNYKPFFGNDSI